MDFGDDLGPFGALLGHMVNFPRALAQLGFLVVILDGRGTPGRSRDFHFPPGMNLLGSAGNLKGKLFLVHGALDDNIHPGNTHAVVDALIKANKDFDLLTLPNAAHSPGEAEPYFLRRQWDYFVSHLLGMRPPEGYRVGAD